MAQEWPQVLNTSKDRRPKQVQVVMAELVAHATARVEAASEWCCFEGGAR